MFSNKLNKNAITEKLIALKIGYVTKYHTKPVFTSEEAARERKVRLSQIVKTMLLIDKYDKITIAVLPGDKKLDMKKIKKKLGVKNLKFVDKEMVDQRLGLVVGAIAPIVELFNGMKVYVDPSVYNEELVDISSGDPKAGLELRSKDLKKLLNGAVVEDITKT